MKESDITSHQRKHLELEPVYTTGTIIEQQHNTHTADQEESVHIHISTDLSREHILDIVQSIENLIKDFTARQKEATIVYINEDDERDFTIDHTK